MEHAVQRRPRVAIVDSNTLAALGLRRLLQEVIPVMEVDAYGSFAELSANGTEGYVHFFVAMSVVLEHRSFFLAHRQKTIVLTLSLNPHAQLADFHCLCVNVSESLLVRSLLQLEQQAHAGGRHLPPMQMQGGAQTVLSRREIEVLALIVQGYLNKEIAERLHISLTTVITHRRHLVEKLGMRSVSALTIYAVMHGYVDINKLTS